MPALNKLGTIWIVDDSSTDAERVAECLRDDFDVRIFKDGPAALEALASGKCPDLLLLDWLMPGMSGLEVCKYVRSTRASQAQIPIILLTAQQGSNEIEEAFSSGANDYVVKPFVAAELKARVRTLTSSKRHLERAQSLVKELQRSEERLLLATSSGGVGIWEWDVESNVLNSTEIHRKLFDLPIEGRLELQALLDRIVPDDREHFYRDLTSAVTAQAEFSSEFRIQKTDGGLAWIYGHGRTISGEGGAHARMVGIHLDITTRKNAEAELKRAKDDAERANQMKSAFLANMSHEIRTPLGAMLGFASLMQDPLITEMELAEYLAVLTRNGEQLSVLINDILDLSKVEAGLLTYEPHELDPELICADVVSLFKAKAKSQNLTLSYVRDPSTPKIATTDPTRLKQILMNLVGNAMKFTHAGGIEIRTFATKVDGDELLSVDVKDTGVGVPPEHADRIFEMFVQGDNSITRKFGGTGIGLALSRRLSRELGGDLILLPKGQEPGATFRVSVLNQTPSNASRSAPLTAAATAKLTNHKMISLAGVRVLVIDDAPDNQQLLTLYLTKRGATVDVCSNGAEGYQKALKAPYDVVLMDLQMPLMDGYTATKKLRAEGYKKPIIALTAHAMSEVSAKCLEAGCNGYLPKPINPADLIQTVANFKNH